MSAMTDYLENKIIDWLFRGVAYTPATTLYFGLLTAAAYASLSGSIDTAISLSGLAQASASLSGSLTTPVGADLSGIAACVASMTGDLTTQPQGAGGGIITWGDVFAASEPKPATKPRAPIALFGVAACTCSAIGSLSTNPRANRFREEEELALILALAA